MYFSQLWVPGFVADNFAPCVLAESGTEPAADGRRIPLSAVPVALRSAAWRHIRESQWCDWVREGSGRAKLLAGLAHWNRLFISR